MRYRLLFLVPAFSLMASMALAGSSRFTVTEPVSGEPIVTDRVTGLIWQKSYTTGVTSWQTALAYCENLSYGGQTDWRLPNVKELTSLINLAIYSPASDFPDMPSQWFWSSSSLAVNPSGGAWLVGFSEGCISYYGKASTSYARCVRGET